MPDACSVACTRLRASRLVQTSRIQLVWFESWFFCIRLFVRLLSSLSTLIVFTVISSCLTRSRAYVFGASPFYFHLKLILLIFDFFCGGVKKFFFFFFVHC